MTWPIVLSITRGREWLDGPSPPSSRVWDHRLDVDGEPHRVLHDTDVVHPDESATIAGPNGTHPPEGGRWEPTLLEVGEYTVALEVRSLDRMLLTDEATVEVSYG